MIIYIKTFLRYKDGRDKMGFHKDDEKELSKDVPIASLTLGAERDFVFKHQVGTMYIHYTVCTMYIVHTYLNFKLILM